MLKDAEITARIGLFKTGMLVIRIFFTDILKEKRHNFLKYEWALRSSV